MTKYILFGCGGFFFEVYEYLFERANTCESEKYSFEITDIIDSNGGRYEEACELLKYKPRLHNEFSNIKNPEDKQTIIALGNPSLRQKVYSQMKQSGFQFETFIHKTAWIASSAKIEEGSIICPYVFVGPKTNIAPNCVVNVRATIAHDVKLGHSTVISPHADLNGNSECGREVLVGANVVFDPGVKVGAYSKIASGAVIKQSYDEGFLLTGNPAKGRQMFKVPTKN